MYDCDYFIKKFEAIPEDNWWVGDFRNMGNHCQFCALGHCGMTYHNSTKESDALDELFGDAVVPEINDGENPAYQQPTPKQRILAALYDIKKLSEPQPQYEDVTKSLAVLPVSEVSDIVGQKQKALI